MFNEIKNFFEKVKYENGGFPIGVKILAAVLAVMILYKTGFNLIYIPYIFVHIILLIFSLLMHELGHGYMAKLCGDNTASYYGRLSLNPLKHLDPIGTILPIISIIAGFPFIMGWAKPVPVNYNYLRNGRKGEFLVASAGIMVNFFLAVTGCLIFKFFHFGSHTLMYFIYINIVLGVFNLLPIPPLDGSRIIASMGDDSLRYKVFEYDRYGFLLIMFLAWSGLLERIINTMTDGVYFLINLIIF